LLTKDGVKNVTQDDVKSQDLASVKELLRLLVKKIESNMSPSPYPRLGTWQQVYFLSKEDDTITVNLGKPITNDKMDKNGRRTAFTQNSCCVTLASLRTAQTTADLKPIKKYEVPTIDVTQSEKKLVKLDVHAPLTAEDKVSIDGCGSGYPDIEQLKLIHRTTSAIISEFKPRNRDQNWLPFVPESLEAAIAVEQHRWYWRPKEVKFVLLAESHVHTDADDLTCKINQSRLPEAVRDIPEQFVRLVYCLGYGQNGLLHKTPQQRNNGTAEYWEILGQCVDTWQDSPLTPDWQIRTLRKLQEAGIWLADASIHACMNPRRQEPYRNIADRFKNTLYRDIINESWQYVRPTIAEAAEVWYIGKNLMCVLEDPILDKTKYIPQPAGRKNPKTRADYNTQLPKLIEAARKLRQ
jgi:hypothetical protein